MPKPFKGKIELDIRDAVPDWEALPPGQGAGGRTERAGRPLMADDAYVDVERHLAAAIARD